MKLSYFDSRNMDKFVVIVGLNLDESGLNGNIFSDHVLDLMMPERPELFWICRFWGHAFSNSQLVV